MEREYILLRQREGIDIAKANGVYKGRKRIERTNLVPIMRQWQCGEIAAVDAMRQLVCCVTPDLQDLA